MSALPPNYPEGQYPPGMPQYGAPMQPAPSNTPATLSLVFGCLTLIFSLLAAIPAVILGFIGIKKAREPGFERTKGMAVAGIIVAVVVLLLQVGATLTLIPALNRAKEQAMSVKSMANLRQISMGMVMFTQDNKNHMPRDLEVLYKYIKDPRVFRHPGNTAPWPDARRLTQEGDYVYVYADATRADPLGPYHLPLKMTDFRSPSSVIVLHERPESAVRGQINVAFADGHAERIPAEELQSRLARQVPPPSRR